MNNIGQFRILHGHSNGVVFCSAHVESSKRSKNIFTKSQKKNKVKKVI